MWIAWKIRVFLGGAFWPLTITHSTYLSLRTNNQGMPAILAEIKGRIPSSYQLHKRSFQFDAFSKSMHIAFLSCSKHTVLAFQTYLSRRRRMHELIESRTKRTALEFDSPRRELWLNSPERAALNPFCPWPFSKVLYWYYRTAHPFNLVRVYKRDFDNDLLQIVINKRCA